MYFDPSGCSPQISIEEARKLLRIATQIEPNPYSVNVTTANARAVLRYSVGMITYEELASQLPPEVLIGLTGDVTFFKNYQSAVSYWSAKYAIKSDGIEYGAIIYKLRAGMGTYYFMGETYSGFKTKNWYTVINGLVIGLLTSQAYEIAGNAFSPITSLNAIGFAHTHPIGHLNNPSEPDKWMKGSGFLIGLKIFPIAIYSKNRIYINYF